MNINNWKKGIKDLKKITLDPAEKNAMLERILNAPIPYPIPFYRKSISYVATALIVSISSGGIAYAAEGSVPGDLLYPVKINVTEPIRDVIAITPKAKADWELEKTSRRLHEATVLATKDKLDQEKREDMEDRLEKQVVKAGISDETKHEVKERLNASAKVLKEIRENKKDGEKNEIEKFEKKIKTTAEKITDTPREDKTGAKNTKPAGRKN